MELESKRTRRARQRQVKGCVLSYDGGVDAPLPPKDVFRRACLSVGLVLSKGGKGSVCVCAHVYACHCVERESLDVCVVSVLFPGKSIFCT